MKLKVIIHNAEEGGYWPEVPATHVCMTQGDTWEELLQNIYKAVDACLNVDINDIEISKEDTVFEVVV